MIFDIKKFAVHDGPGIRTTVFVKGCPLRCPWCHNPEGLSRKREIALDPRKCIGCRACLENCERGGHEIGPNGEHLYHIERCVLCGACAQGCYAGAIEMVGEEKTAQEVMDVVIRDQPFYDNSGGGLTLSGGEPLYQPAFAEAILRLCRKAGISTTIESSCAAPWATLERLISLVDMWMCDVKHVDPAKHRDLVGADNGVILNNLRKLCKIADVMLRLPLVPGLNDDEAGLRALGAFVREVNPRRGLEVMPYHRLGEGKYERIQKTYSLDELPAATDGDIRRAADLLHKGGAERVFCERIPEL